MTAFDKKINQIATRHRWNIEKQARVTVPAASKKDAAEYVRGNGDVVAIKPADLQDIDLDALADTLKRAQWGQMEIDIITRALAACGLDR